MKRRIRQVLVTGFLASSLPAIAAAGPIDDAVAARLKGDYEAALRILRPLAEKGDASAQSNLGFMNVREAAATFDRAEAEALAVVDPQRHVVGLLTEAYVLRRYAEESEQRRRDALGEA